MSNIPLATKYLKLGFNPVPLPLGSKVPNRKDWGSLIEEEKIAGYGFEEIGVCTGQVSKGLEVIDFDLDVLDDEEAKEVWLSWKRTVDKELLSKLVVAQTKSGGYHVYYRTTVIEGNKKLAKLDDGKTIMIETRGEGGYVKCAPSEGYEWIYGDLSKVHNITDAERYDLITNAIYLDRSPTKDKYYSDGDYEDPFPEYNADIDIGIGLLEEHGWTVYKENDEWVEFTKPDASCPKLSAGYNKDKKFLYVFTTSTEFDTEKPYSNSAIYCILEHDGNFKAGYKDLYEAGYGIEGKEEVAEDIMDLSFLSKDGEDEDKLEQFIRDEIPLGLSFGWPELDDYFLYKQNTLNFILAFEGVGKTYMALHKLVALATLYGKKFAICCGENDVSTIKRFILEAACGKKISYYKDNREELRIIKDWMNYHFFVFKNEKHYSVEDILDRAKVLKGLYSIDGVLIDPFSYFKRPTSGQYGYNDDLLSKLNIFSHNEMSVFMTVHPNTDASRAPRDQEGYLQPPTHYDAIGGNIFANRTDHFLVYHRIVNHRVPALRRIMEIKTAKVKDISTGGSVTPIGESTSLTYKTHNGFIGYFDSNNHNPMYEKSKEFKEEIKKELPKLEPTDGIF